MSSQQAITAVKSLRITDFISKFDGSEDVELWLDKLDLAVEIFGSETDIVSIIPLFLMGDAYATFKQLQDGERSDIEAIKKALRRVFGKSKAEAWKELKSLVLIAGESVDIQRIVCAGKDPAEKLVAAYFLDAIPNKVGEQVRVLHGEDMSLVEVVSAAKALLVSVSADYVNDCVGVGMLCYNTDKRKIERPNFQGSIPKCYGCGRFGHVKTFCKTDCFGCGEIGHVKDNCPNRRSGNGKVGTAVRQD